MYSAYFENDPDFSNPLIPNPSSSEALVNLPGSKPGG